LLSSLTTVTRTAVVTARSAVMTGIRIHQLPTAAARTTRATIRRADVVKTISKVSPRSWSGGGRRPETEGSFGCPLPSAARAGGIRADR
jgi:hypothetical protein